MALEHANLSLGNKDHEESSDFIKDPEIDTEKKKTLQTEDIKIWAVS